MWSMLKGLRLPGRRKSVSLTTSLPIFRLMVQREKVRVDRTAGEFSLVVVTPDARTSSKKVRILSRRIREQLRSSDLMTQLDSRRFSVLLPDTSLVGAETYVGRVQPLLSDVCSSIEFKVYAYRGNRSVERGADFRAGGRLGLSREDGSAKVYFRVGE